MRELSARGSDENVVCVAGLCGLQQAEYQYHPHIRDTNNIQNFDIFTRLGSHVRFLKKKSRKHHGSLKAIHSKAEAKPKPDLSIHTVSP